MEGESLGDYRARCHARGVRCGDINRAVTCYENKTGKVLGRGEERGTMDGAVFGSVLADEEREARFKALRNLKWV